MTLLEKQKVFTRLLAKLIQNLIATGHDPVVGQVERSTEMAKLYLVQGKGIANSLHCLKLAADIALFHGDKYLTSTADYAEAGDYWENLSTADYECCWGGRFNDGNHFSIKHNGVR